MLLQKINNIIDSFEPISLIEMDTVKLMNRVDTKFVFSKIDLERLLPILTKDYYILNVEGERLSKYVSLYFDDANYSCYNDHHKGKVNRFKVRYRTYVNSKLTFLEVKHKIKGRTRKHRIKVDKIPSAMNDSHFDFVKKAGVLSTEMNPTLMNDFIRMTLVNKAMSERLTIDLNLTFENKGKNQSVENVVIAELKQGKAMRNSPFYQLMKVNQIRPLKISKYTLGMIMLYSKSLIKYNRFKKKIIKLSKIDSNAA